MSLVKELVDLVTQLDDSLTDRKYRDLVLPIREMALKVQQEHLEMEKQLLESEQTLFESERRHAKEMAAADARYSGLESRYQAVLDQTLMPHRGFLWDSRVNPHCPACKSPLTLYTDTRFAKCVKCDQCYEFHISGRAANLEELQIEIREYT